jgi:hypothetical protein
MPPDLPIFRRQTATAGRRLLAIPLCLGLFVGCAESNLRKDDAMQADTAKSDASQADASQLRQMRPADPAASPVGVSAKSRQIEQDFGIQ